MKKTKQGSIFMVVLGILLVAVVAGIYFYNKNIAKDPTAGTTNSEGIKNSSSTSPVGSENATSSTKTRSTVKGGANPDLSSGTFSSGEEELVGSDISVVGVDFDGSAFSPNTVNLKKGDYVFFKNVSTKPLTLASESLKVSESIAVSSNYKIQFTSMGDFVFTNGAKGSAVMHVVVQ